MAKSTYDIITSMPHVLAFRVRGCFALFGHFNEDADFNDLTFHHTDSHRVQLIYKSGTDEPVIICTISGPDMGAFEQFDFRQFCDEAYSVTVGPWFERYDGKVFA